MKRILFTIAAMMVATMAFAGTASKTSDMTPQQAMATMGSCPVCSVWMTEPALGPNIRHSVFATKSGYVETLMTADQSTMPAFEKCAAECEKRAATIPTMAKDQKDKLCPLCSGQMAFMSRTDVTVETFKTEMGLLSVASATTPDGVKALHEYARTSEEFGRLLSKAGAEMSKEPMKSKM
jgi:hypothetical protein